MRVSEGVSIMAFGQTVKEKSVKQATDGEQTQVFEWQWIPLNGSNKRDKLGSEQIYKGGSRKIRLLPEIVDGKPTNESAAEVRFLEVWMQVMVDGQMKPRRVILDWRKPFNNPYWNRVANPTEKGSPERKAQKQKFAMNVIDLTPVVQDSEGRYVYPNENGQYIVSAQGKLVDEINDKPQPLRKVRILEQTAGDQGGKHFLQQLINAFADLEDSNGEPRQPHEVDVVIRVTGVDVDTSRSVRPTANFNPLSDDLLLAPRYDLATWAQPWPDEAVNALIDGADFAEVVEQFNIKLWPELETSAMDAAAEAVLSEPVVETKPKKAKSKKVEDDNLFDD